MADLVQIATFANVADFVELHRLAIGTSTSHSSVVFTSARRLPRTRRGIGRMVRALDALLAVYPATDALHDQTWWLEPGRR